MKMTKARPNRQKPNDDERPTRHRLRSLRFLVRTRPFRPKRVANVNVGREQSSTKQSTRCIWTGMTCSWKTFWRTSSYRRSLRLRSTTMMRCRRRRQKWTSTVSSCGRNTSQRLARESRLWGHTDIRLRPWGCPWPSWGRWNIIRLSMNDDFCLDVSSLVHQLQSNKRIESYTIAAVHYSIG